MANSEFDREVEHLMKPIKKAGYASLPYDKTIGSLEEQLRSGLHEAIESLLRAESLITKIPLRLKTTIKDTQVEFLFEVTCDARSRQSVFLSGMEAKVGRRSEYHLFEPTRSFPKPVDAFDRLMRFNLKPKKEPRQVKKKPDSGKRL